ncbi:hypothetical protein CBS9595_003023 [Malassezia furfur]|nr:hypothetical protein CBS9595_003023 [Malassezia furfur]
MLPPGSVPLAHPCVGDARMLVLPHPHSGVPSYFVLSEADARLYEVLIVRPDAPHARSWFVGHADGAPRSDAPGAVVRDGALRILSPIDPLFVLLGLLADVDARHFCPLDDLAESAAELHARRRAASVPDGGEARPWPDIVPFVMHNAMAEHLPRLCDTQSEAAADTGCVYRLSMPKIHAELDAKRARLAQSAVCDAAPETFGRQVRKALTNAHSATDAEVAAAQADTARAMVLAYCPPSVAAGWVA